ncbi:MAG TPA: SWIM zinc finger family protein [Dehalococcoidia bacterium]|nr:SWIM zinc finger family protein [Dehalococcoidia bacterium]
MTTASPRRQSSVAKVARLHQHPDSGAVHALSSDGRTVYVVKLGDTTSCTCIGFSRYGRCYHVSTALERFPAFYTRPAAVIVPVTEPEPPTPAAPAFLVAGTYIPGKLFSIGGRARRAA